MFSGGTYLLLAIPAILLFRGSTTFTVDTGNATVSATSFRLPTSLHPLRYNLHIVTHIHQDIQSFDGNVTIDLAVMKHTDEIILHADRLRDFGLTLTDLFSNQMYENLEFSHDNLTDLLRIYSSAEPLDLQFGRLYRLQIVFNGDIQPPHFGFYRNTYKDENNKTIPIATTQFEPTSARLAFPCFDEPSFKSRFIISITHGSNYSALSNMPINGDPILSPDGEMATTTFLETPLMPTYLLAFIVSNYKYIAENVNGIEHRVFLPPHSQDNGYRALKNAIKSVIALENYLGINYKLPKLDHIRLDKTYGSAMENWGLITYSKKNFIPAVEGKDKHATLKLFIVQNHEIAHQWFGNLVSPKWWTYAWLNEGFATYFAYIVTELVYPDMRVSDFFIDAEVEVTFSWPIDHAMTHYVEKEADIKSVFDVVVYQKAACFIKMFHHAIGHKTFIKGLSQFLDKFQYSVADEEDLFKVLQSAVNEDENQLFQGEHVISNIMHTWTHNQGIPIVTVIRNYDDDTITLRQRSNTKHKEETWWIPLNFVTASNPDFNKTVADYIMPPQHEVTISLKDLNIDMASGDWLIVNKKQTGLQYVHYDDHNLELIAEALNTDHRKIHMLNRALLFRDLAANLHKELSRVEPLFEILRYLHFEDDWMPWKAATDLILDLRSNLCGSQAFEMFKAFARDIIGPMFLKYQEIPKAEFAVADLSSRTKIVDAACQVDLKECLNHTKTLCMQYFFHGVKIDDAVRDISMCQGIKYFTHVEFQQLIEKLVTSNPNSEFYDDIIYSIRCVESPENLKYFLELILGENSTYNVMSDYESMQYLAFVYVSNYFSRPVILEFMRENYKSLCKKSNIVTAMLDRISNYVSEDDGQKEEFLDLLEQVKDILKEKADFEDRNIGSRIRSRENFRRKYEKSIHTWLTNNDRERTARSGDTNRTPTFTAARYIVAAGFISNLISFV